jgi:putative transposase
MPQSPVNYHRHSIRLPDYDYTQPGAYFVTLNAWQSEWYFCEQMGQTFSLTQTGRIITAEWQHLPQRFPHVELDEFIVMPDHFHAILIFQESGSSFVRARQNHELSSNSASIASPTSDTYKRLPHGVPAGSLGAVIGAFKSTTTRLVNALSHTPSALPWHRNYYERIIRDEPALQQARQYIQDNPRKWMEKHGRPF